MIKSMIQLHISMPNYIICITFKTWYTEYIVIPWYDVGNIPKLIFLIPPSAMCVCGVCVRVCGVCGVCVCGVCVCVCIDTPHLWCMCVCYCNVNDILDVCMLLCFSNYVFICACICV